MNDEFWTALRYVLIASGSFFVGRGMASTQEVMAFADLAVQVGSGAIALGTALWGLYVRWNTKAVPAPVAARPDVPTVNSATGVVQR